MISDKLGRNEVRNAFMVNQLETKKALDDLAAKSYAYYKKDHLEILSYLGQHLGVTIKDPSILRRMPIVYLNDIPRIVRRLAMVYKTTPERIYSSEPSEELQAILNKNDKWFKEFHRQAKLLNTIAVRPLWREKYQKFDFLILGRHLANVIPEENKL